MRRLSLILSVLLLTSPVQAQATRPTAATTPSVPMVCLSVAPRPDAEQLREVLRVAALARPQGREIWFVLVSLNRPGNFDWKVFYTPDRSTPRLRAGRYLYGYTPEAVGKYRQVSESGKIFGKTLEVPAVAYSPFPVPRYPQRLWEKQTPKEIGDDELVKVVDLAREEFETRATDDPVCGIVSAPGVVAVACGIEDDGGTWVHICRDGDVPRVVRRGGWSDDSSGYWPMHRW